MSEIINAIAEYEAIRERENHHREPSQKRKDDDELQVAFGRIVSAETRSATWTQEEHAAYAAFRLKWGFQGLEKPA